MAGLTGWLRPVPSAAHAGEYHSTAPLLRPSVGDQGVVVPVTP
jgi:hypothetical protein